jgi:hypothetical protein
MSANVGRIAQSLLVEAAYPHLALPAIEQAANEAHIDPWVLLAELLRTADRVRAVAESYVEELESS